MAKRPHRAPPARNPGNPDFSAPQRTKPRVLKILLKTSQNFPPRFPLIFPSPAPKVLHKNPVTGKGPIKRMQRGRRGKVWNFPRREWCRQARQANFGSVGGGAGGEVARGAANVKAMEMHLVRRSVYGGPAQMLLKKRRATIPCGGSRGPADPWSAAAASKRRGEALERLCREIAQRCADGRSDKRARSSVSGRRSGGHCKRAGALPYLRTVMKEQR